MGDGDQRSGWEGTRHPGCGGAKPLASVFPPVKLPGLRVRPRLSSRGGGSPCTAGPARGGPPWGHTLTTAEGQPPGAQGAGLCGGSPGASPEHLL